MGISVSSAGKSASTTSAAASSAFSPSISTSADATALLDELFSTSALGTPVDGSDFVILDKPNPYYVALVYGYGGEGKTFFSCNVDGPVWLLNLDGRAEDTVRSLMAGGPSWPRRDIRFLRSNYPLDILEMEYDAAKQIAQTVLARFKRNFNLACRSGGHIVIDTVDELLLLIKLAVRGRTDRPLGTKEDKGDYGKSDALINDCLWYFSNKVREQRQANLVLISRAKQEREGRELTGRNEYTAHRIFFDAVDWAVELALLSPREVMADGGGNLSPMQIINAGNQGGRFSIEVAKSGCALDQMGKSYKQAEWEEAGMSAIEYCVSRLKRQETSAETLPGSVDDWINQP